MAPYVSMRAQGEGMEQPKETERSPIDLAWEAWRCLNDFPGGSKVVAYDLLRIAFWYGASSGQKVEHQQGAGDGT